MNINNMKKLINYLKKVPDSKFYMADYYVDPKLVPPKGWSHDHAYPECGTAACIAGHAAIAFSKKPVPYDECFDFGKNFLELNDEEAEDLFLGYFSHNDIIFIKKSEAIEHMEWMVKSAS